MRVVKTFLACFSVLAFVFAWLVPNHYLPWTAFYNDALTVVGFLLLSWLILLLMAGEGFGVVIHRTPLAVLAVAAIPLVQFGFGGVYFFGDAVMASCYLLLFSLACIVGASIFRKYDYGFPDVLAWSFLAGALVSVFLAANQWLEINDQSLWLASMPPGGRPFANLVQPNNLATLFVLGLVATLYLHERGHVSRGTNIMILGALMAGIAMARSRTSILLMLTLAAWLIYGQKKINLKWGRLEVFLSLCTFLVLWMLWPSLSNALSLNSFGSEGAVQHVVHSTEDVRALIWQQLLNAVWRQPLAGYGWNQVSVAQTMVAADYPNSSYVEHSHNLLIDLLVWNGVVLGGILITAIGWWLFSRVRRCDSMSGGFCLLVVILVASHGMLEFPLEYAYFLVPVGLCVGAVEAQQSKYVALIGQKTWLAILTLTTGLFVWIFAEYQQLEYNHRRLRAESIGLEQSSGPSEVPRAILLTQLAEYLRFARTPAYEGMPEEQIKWMCKVAHRYAFPPALFRCALALGLNGYQDDGLLELRRLKQLHDPRHFEDAKRGLIAMSDRFPQLRYMVDQMK